MVTPFAVQVTVAVLQSVGTPLSAALGTEIIKKQTTKMSYTPFM